MRETKINKNSEYSELLLDEGSRTPCDADVNFVQETPPWADHKRYNNGRLFFLLNINASVRAIILGLLTITPEETIFKILEFTKQSSTPLLAYKRYRLTFLHGNAWGQSELKPGTKAWDSITHVRRIHLTISKRADRNEIGIISQKDMALVQYAFVGAQLLTPEKLGLFGSSQQFEDFAFYWRMLGYTLGIEDRFNICGETFEETLSRCAAVKEILRPNFVNLSTKAEEYLRIAIEGMKGFEPWLHADTQLFIVKRLLGVPGYHYFDNEAVGDVNERAFDKLDFKTRTRIALEIFFIETLGKVWLLRWTMNIFRLAFGAITDRFPLFAILKFGRKHAYIEIFKSKSQREKKLE